MRPLRPSEVSSAMTAWAEYILDSAKPFGYEETRLWGDRAVLARVEHHDYSVRLQKHGDFRGVTLYDVTTEPHPTPTHDTYVEGVDVSAYQRNVDWQAVRASGRSFVWIKVSEGVTYTSPTLLSQWVGAGDAGFLRGGYHFWHATSDPIEQAKHYLAKCPAGSVLPHVLDLEVWDGKDPAFVVNSAAAWLDYIDTQTRHPVLYISSSFLARLSDSDRFALLKLADLWIAHWDIPAPGTDHWTFWQYSAESSVPGIPDHADVNRFHGDSEELKRYCGIVDR